MIPRATRSNPGRSGGGSGTRRRDTQRRSRPRSNTVRSESIAGLQLLPTLLAMSCCLLLLLAPVGASWSMEVEHGVEECFVVRAPDKTLSTISGNYDLLDDELSADPLRVTLYDAKDKKLWVSDVGESEGKFSVENVKGVHRLCMSNGIEYDDDTGNEDERNVGFAVRVRPTVARGLPDGEEGPDDELTEHLVEMSEDLVDDFEDLADHMAYLKIREAEHRELTEQTFSRIARWTIMEALVLMVIAGGQVLYLRKFFEKKIYL